MTNIEKVTAAIRRLSSEHGLPNRFAVSEIATECGLSNLVAGQVLARNLAAVDAVLPVGHLDREKDGPITFIAVQ